MDQRIQNKFTFRGQVCLSPTWHLCGAAGLCIYDREPGEGGSVSWSSGYVFNVYS